MAQYFVRYRYNTLVKKIGYSTEIEEITDSVIFDFDPERLSISNVQGYIYSYELNYLENRPDAYEIEILTMNRL